MCDMLGGLQMHVTLVLKTESEVTFIKKRERRVECKAFIFSPYILQALKYEPTCCTLHTAVYIGYWFIYSTIVSNKSPNAYIGPIQDCRTAESAMFMKRVVSAMLGAR